MTACSDGGDGNAQLTSLFLTPTTLTMDAGQTSIVTASIVNDVNPGGATFAVTGGGTVGSPTTSTAGNTEKVSVNYTAPVTATTATVTATSVHAPTQMASVVITVNPALALTTTSLPAGSTNTAYDVKPVAAGGTGTLTWSIANGALPAGLGLNTATGEISGTPTAAATSTFTLAVTDSAPTPMTAVQTFNLVINPPLPAVSTSTLPAAIVGTAYSQQLSYTGGGTGTVIWAISAGSLPGTSGLTLSSGGLISGTPAIANATYSFSVTVTVGTQTSAPVALTLKTVAPLVVSTTSLPNGYINVSYSQQLAYTGGDGTTAKWSLVSGSLPSTLTLSSNGLLSGTPTAAATYTIGVAVTVGAQTSATQTLSLAIVSTQISSASSASGEVGLPFAFQVTALGGTAPYTYSLATGSHALPPGLSINAMTGLISGTPSTNVGSPFSGVVVEATDSIGSVGMQTMTFTIAASRGSAANGELSGQYAFLLSGFDAAGNPVSSVGTFTANGSGGITSGVVDTNGTAMSSALANVSLVASNYALGADGRGQITLTTAASSATYSFAINSVSGGLATGGALTEFDATGQRLSGQFLQQTTSAFSLPAINTGFAFGVFGFTANSSASSLHRSGTIGEIQFAGVSAVASSELVTSASGGTPVVPTSGTFTIGANGRGTLALVLPGTSGTMNFAAYVVSTSQMFLLSTDAASGSATTVRDLLAGNATSEAIANGSYTNASLSGTSVFQEERFAPGTLTASADIQAGLYTFDGAGNITGTEDRNAAGAVTQTELAGTYTVATNGRVTAQIGVSGFGGCLDCARTSSVFYLAGAMQGYTLDFSTAGGTGSFDQQTTAAFTASSLNGMYSLETDGPLMPAALLEDGLLTASGSGSVTGLLDQSAVGVLTPDVALNDVATVAANGRVALLSGSTSAAVLYMTSPTRGVWLDMTSSVPTTREINHQ